MADRWYLTTDLHDPRSITLYSGSGGSRPRHVVLELWIHPSSGSCNPARFRLHFCTLGEVRASEDFAVARFAATADDERDEVSLVSASFLQWGETNGGLSLVWISYFRINLDAGASVLGRAQQLAESLDDRTQPGP